MVLGLEVELRRLSPAAHLDVGVFVLSDRHRFVRQVGDGVQARVQALLGGAGGLLERLDLRGDLLHPGLFGRGVPPRALRFSDRLRGLVAPPPEFLAPRQEPLPVGVGGHQLVERVGAPPGGQPFLYQIQVFPHEVLVQHALFLCLVECLCAFYH